jgi:hypothetical protein
MKLFLIILILIPSLSWGKSFYLCKKDVGKEFTGLGILNVSELKFNEKEWGDETIILKRTDKKVTFSNSEYLPIDEFEIFGNSSDTYFSAKDLSGSRFLRFSNKYITYSGVSLSGGKINFLIASCEEFE